MRWLYSIMLAGLLMPTAAQAAVINYDEAVDGELSYSVFSFEPTPVFNLGIGENTFSGEVTLTSERDELGNDLTEYDSFGFNIPDNAQLTSILINTALLTADDTLGGTGYEILDSQKALISSQFESSVPIPTNNTSLLDSTLPLGSGTFYFYNSYLSFGGFDIPENYSSTAAYKLSFNVQSKPIPEPSSTLGLAVIGSLGAFSLFNRKIKRRVTN